MVSQPESVNTQAGCNLLLTGGRVINRKTALNDVADVAISAGTVVAMALSPQGAGTI
jgi:predicted amidohydrolase